MPDNKAWRRFIAEGLVIVVSILLAFWIDAWWDGRQERNRGYAYMRLLAADLRATLENNAVFGGNAGDAERAVIRLIHAYYEPVLPPRDSLAAWFVRATGWWVVQPRLGIAQALVETGDLNLLPSDSVRAAVPTYLTVMREFERFEQLGLDRFEAANDELRDRVNLQALRLETLSRAARDSAASASAMFPYPAGPLRPQPRVNVEALVLDDDVHRILWRMGGAKAFMRTYRELMKQQAEQLLAEVEDGLMAK